jgi:HSP20 family protein
MADITVRHSGNTPVPQSRTSQTPGQWVRALMGWDPFQEMEPWPTYRGADFNPTFDVKETKEGFVFRADLPGIQEKDIDVTLTGNRLVISGKREEEKKEQSDVYFACERSYGSFTRAFTLPEGVDAGLARADYKNGVLTLLVPKKPEAQPKKIAVKAGSPS